MKFWIVTPSYNQLDWLKLCIASVKDQAGNEISVHHHIQDAASTDGTRELLAEQLNAEPKPGYSFSYASEPDGGMYDAINRGWLKAGDDVDVIAHLNCDEQYLPEALGKVAAAVKKKPNVDILLTDMLVVDEQGNYICHRRSLKPRAWLSRFWCAAATAVTFQRKSFFDKKRVLFDASWRNIGDKVWYNDLHRAGCRFGVCHDFTSIFTDSDTNMNLTRESQEERDRYEKEYRNATLVLRGIMSKIQALKRMLLEFWYRKPSSYCIYERESMERVEKMIAKPTAFWRRSFPVFEENNLNTQGKGI